MKRSCKAVVFFSLAALTFGCGCSGLRLGTAAPDFTLQDLGGQKFSLSQFKGSPILLTYFATW